MQRDMISLSEVAGSTSTFESGLASTGFICYAADLVTKTCQSVQAQELLEDLPTGGAIFRATSIAQ